MPTDTDPIIDNWYQFQEKSQEFMVVALDDMNNTVEIQYFDGSLAEMDRDNWYEMDLEAIAPPENWAGAVDVGNVDDLGTEVTDTAEEDWSAPLEEIRDVQPEPAEEESSQSKDAPVQEESWEGDL